MKATRVLRRTAWDFLAAVACCTAVISPVAGCLQGGGSLDLGDLLGVGPNAGLFINNDFNDPLLMAGRNDAGDAFFVFGSRKSNGDLREIDAIVVRTAAGEQSFLAFEDGRPRRAEGPAGSYVEVTYEEVTAERLAGVVEFYNAETNVAMVYPVDIDLKLAVETVAEQVRAATGMELPIVEAEDGTAAGGKGRDTEQTRVTIFSPLFVVFVLPLVALVAFTQLILGQILLIVYAAIELALRAVLLTAFAPLFLVAAVLQVSITRISVIGIGTIFSSVPPRPGL